MIKFNFVKFNFVKLYFSKLLLIILFILFIFYIIDIIINRLEYFDNHFKCDTYGEICNQTDYKTDTCCSGYKCMRKPGNFNYKICVRDKNYVPKNAYIHKPSKKPFPNIPGLPALPNLFGTPESPKTP